MKKKWFNSGFQFESQENLFKKMKLIAFFFFASLITVSASTYSQQVRFNLMFNDISVKDVFYQIEENSEFVLFYNEDYVDVDRKITLDAKESTVEYILDEVFKGTNNTYRIYDRQIVILAPGKTENPSILNSSFEQPLEKNISGMVTDVQGFPLPGVAVVVKNTTVGTVTNTEGKFSFSAPGDAEALQFSFVGMKTMEIAIAGQLVFNIILEEEMIGVDEVIVVGYGVQKKERCNRFSGFF